MELGFVGLGVMGIRMVRNLVKKGYTVTAYDIRKAAMEEASRMGALTTSSPQEVAQSAEVVLLSLPSSSEVKEVIFGPNGVVKAAKSSIIVNLSTMDPAASMEVEEKLKEYRNIRFLDIPVSGGSHGAEEGTLTLIVSGDPQTSKEVEGVLKSIGREMVFTGPIGTAQVVKLANNAMAAVNTMALIEALTWTTKQNVNPNVLFAVASKSSGNSWVLRNRLPKIMKRDFKPGFSVRLMHKDLNLFLKSAKERSLTVPFTDLANNLLQAAKRKGFEDDDYGIVAKLFEEAGMTETQREQK